MPAAPARIRSQPGGSASAAWPAAAGWQLQWVAPLLAATLGVLAFGSSLQGGFVYDDLPRASTCTRATRACQGVKDVCRLLFECKAQRARAELRSILPAVVNVCFVFLFASVSKGRPRAQ